MSPRSPYSRSRSPCLVGLPSLPAPRAASRNPRAGPCASSSSARPAGPDLRSCCPLPGASAGSKGKGSKELLLQEGAGRSGLPTAAGGGGSPRPLLPLAEAPYPYRYAYMFTPRSRVGRLDANGCRFRGSSGNAFHLHIVYHNRVPSGTWHFPCEFCRCFYRSVWSQVATWP